jgi:hypothetical protein
VPFLKRLIEKAKKSVYERLLFTIIVLVNAAGVLVSCRKQFYMPNNVGTMNDTSAVVKFIGSFANGAGGTASGWAKATFKDGRYKLLLKETVFFDRPDLYVYMSKELQPVNFPVLGLLKSFTGYQLYDILGTSDFIADKYALIHSLQYNQLYGRSLML